MEMRKFSFIRYKGVICTELEISPLNATPYVSVNCVFISRAYLVGASIFLTDHSGDGGGLGRKFLESKR
jgi:hypothetical protein